MKIVDDYFGCDVICSNFCRVIRPMQPYSAFFYFAFNYMFKRDIFFKYENSSNGLKNLNLEAVLTDEKIILFLLIWASLLADKTLFIKYISIKP